jgi:hypothetical protein
MEAVVAEEVGLRQQMEVPVDPELVPVEQHLQIQVAMQSLIKAAVAVDHLHM